MTAAFFLYRDSPLRRRSLAAPPGSPERYSLFGLDELRAAGVDVGHNLEHGGAVPQWARVVGALAKRLLEGAGGYGGDFATVFASLRRANRADVVVSTVDTVGIPAMLLVRARLLRRPLVYVAVGLPERLDRLRNERMRRLYASALGACSAVVTYSEHEAEVLRRWLAEQGRPRDVTFIRFGVDPRSIEPSAAPPEDDVVSVGTDPHRDFELLCGVAERLPASSFRLVVSDEHARALTDIPANVSVEVDIPFEAMLRRLAGARVVALPVRENSYSGATTVLLQAMALAKPVVVTRTRAIASGYGLVDGGNCGLVAPGDLEGFAAAVRELLDNSETALALGAAARRTAEAELGWDRYVDRIEQLVTSAARE